MGLFLGGWINGWLVECMDGEMYFLDFWYTYKRMHTYTVHTQIHAEIHIQTHAYIHRSAYTVTYTGYVFDG